MPKEGVDHFEFYMLWQDGTWSVEAVDRAEIAGPDELAINCARHALWLAHEHNQHGGGLIMVGPLYGADFALNRPYPEAT